MSSQNESQESESTLDSLLDEALEDFSKPVPMKPPASSQPSNSDSATGASNVWTEEFIQEATKQFEANIRQMMQQQAKPKQDDDNKDLLDQPLDPNVLQENLSKMAEDAAKAASDSAVNKDFAACLNDTMEQLTKNNTDALAPPSADDLEKMFQNFGLDGGVGGGGGQGFGEEGDSTASGFFPIMQTMMENILSKEVLYPPVKEIVSKYPDWLADNRSSLPEEEFDRYNKQYDIMKQVAAVFDSESESDTPEVKSKNFELVLQFMQKLQDLGQPPKELVGDFGPTMNFDPSGNPLLPDLTSLLGAAGFPSEGDQTPAEAPKGPPGEPESCSLM